MYILNNDNNNNNNNVSWFFKNPRRKVANLPKTYHDVGIKENRQWAMTTTTAVFSGPFDC